MRRLLIAFVVALPALILIGWLVATQLPRWTAPQANWFPAKTPGVCAAVDSLVLYQATRADVGGIGRDTALDDAMLVVVEHYKLNASDIALTDRAVLSVEAALPGDQRRGYYVASIRLNNDPLPKAAVIYLDAESGDPRALITATEDPNENCDFDIKAALLAAVKSPPLLLLLAYGGIVVVAAAARWLFKRRKTR
ncbi:MAG: hypothetical protein GC204_11180 [Chloroflexi bacterium]|nr:hypothetical protein [Chloroflexota bacterium]